MNADQQFESYRPLMFSIAYRMLGSAMEAEDIVQDAFLRYQTIPPESIETPKALLSTIVTRLCLNYLQSARAQRESYIGPWLPEPIHTDTSPESSFDSLSLAFLVLLESLTPVERAVFLLREVFDFEYAEIAGIVDKDEVACRQLFSRARKHVADHRPRFESSPEEHRRLLERFIEAVSAGNLDGLMELLSDDVTVWADGGGKVKGAATKPVHGPAAVARFALASLRFLTEDYTLEFPELNGEQAIVIKTSHGPFAVLYLETTQGKISAIRAIANPDKLKQV